MAALRNATWSSSTASASVSVAKPTGAVNGDTCLVFVSTTHATGTAATLGGMTGWTDSGTISGSNTAFAARAFSRILDGTESWPFAIANNGSVAIACIADYSGASGFDPATIVAPFYQNSSSAPTASSVTLAASGDWLAWFGISTKNGSASANAVSIPTGYANGADSGLITNSLQGIRGEFGDLETAQASGATGTIVGSQATATACWGWAIGIQLGTSGSATLTVPGMTMAAPLVTPAATAQAIPLTVPGATLAAPLITPQATAQVVALTTPHMTLAAPLVSIGRGVNLTTPNMALAAPVLNPQPTAQVVTLTAPQMTFAAPTVTLGVSTNLALTTAQMTFSALPLNPLAIIPTYNNPWYGNQLSPLEADFEGPNVP